MLAEQVGENGGSRQGAAVYAAEILRLGRGYDQDKSVVAVLSCEEFQGAMDVDVKITISMRSWRRTFIEVEAD